MQNTTICLIPLARDQANLGSSPLPKGQNTKT